MLSGGVIARIPGVIFLGRVRHKHKMILNMKYAIFGERFRRQMMKNLSKYLIFPDIDIIPWQVKKSLKKDSSPTPKCLRRKERGAMCPNTRGGSGCQRPAMLPRGVLHSKTAAHQIYGRWRPLCICNWEMGYDPPMHSYSIPLLG